MSAKRVFDVLVSVVGLLLLAPLLLLIALVIKLETPGEVLFRQDRVGRFGRVFRIHKFRTMVAGADKRGPTVTTGTDARVTRVGRVLRRYKLDELVQLIDVLNGDMSIVGPRPEVPRLMAHYPEHARRIVLSVRPGITDWASIHYRDENNLLSAAQDPERTYIDEILPTKIGYYLDYVQHRSFVGDLRIVVATAVAIVRGRAQPVPQSPRARK